MSPGMIDTLSRAAGPDQARAGIEFGSTPIFAPILSIIDAARADGELPEKQQASITIQNLTILTSPFEKGLPAYMSRPNLSMKVGDLNAVDECRCTQSTPNRLVPFMRIYDPRSFRSPIEGVRCPHDLVALDGFNQGVKLCEALASITANAENCLNKMQLSCQYLKVSRYKNEINGILGIGYK
jgi:hypothetical protein